MQVLWSRAAKARSAQCGPYLHATTTLSGRGTRAVARRRVKASDVFTACYTAMFATVAVVDMKNKEARRQQWDKAIEEVRAGKDLAEIQQPEEVEALSSRKEMPTPTLTAQKIVVRVPGSGFENYAQAFEAGMPISSIWDSRGWRTAAHDEKTQLGAELREINDYILEALDSPISESEDPHRVTEEADSVKSPVSQVSVVPPREPQTDQHLNRLQAAIGKLVVQLLVKAGLLSLPGELQALAGTDSSDPELRKKVKDIFRNDMAQSMYLPVHHPNAKDEHVELNRSIAAIFTKNQPHDVPKIVSKICYNLLTTRSPPSIDTYNLMIKQFNRLDCHRLTGIVVDSLLNDTLFRPNEDSCSAILDHYVAAKKKNAFLAFDLKMRGDLQGLKIKSRRKAALCLTSCQDWALNNAVVHRNGFLVQKASRDSQVFESLIRGYVAFSDLARIWNGFSFPDGISTAVKRLRRALKNGCRVTTELFELLVERCLVEAKKDQRIAIQLVDALTSQWMHPRDSSRYPGLVYDRKVRELLQCVLDSLNINSDFSGRKNPLPCSPSIDGPSFDKMIRHIKYQEIRESLVELAKDTAMLEHKIGNMTSSNAAVFEIRISEAKRSLKEWLCEQLSTPRQAEYRYLFVDEQLGIEWLLEAYQHDARFWATYDRLPTISKRSQKYPLSTEASAQTRAITAPISKMPSKLRFPTAKASSNFIRMNLPLHTIQPSTQNVADPTPSSSPENVSEDKDSIVLPESPTPSLPMRKVMSQMRLSKSPVNSQPTTDLTSQSMEFLEHPSLDKIYEDQDLAPLLESSASSPLVGQMLSQMKSSRARVTSQPTVDPAPQNMNFLESPSVDSMSEEQHLLPPPRLIRRMVYRVKPSKSPAKSQQSTTRIPPRHVRSDLPLHHNLSGPRFEVTAS
jgi:hypothetical protein